MGLQEISSLHGRQQVLLSPHDLQTGGSLREVVPVGSSVQTDGSTMGQKVDRWAPHSRRSPEVTLIMMKSSKSYRGARGGPVVQEDFFFISVTLEEFRSMTMTTTTTTTAEVDGDECVVTASQNLE